MTRTKIDYGIDLGTTNSSISRMDNGEHRIIKSTDRQSDTTPSCVHFNEKQLCFVGQKALNLFDKYAKQRFSKFTLTGEISESQDSFLEFKRTMGKDEAPYSSNMDRKFTSEELSAEVLKKLKSYVRDDEVKAAVITVPAMFKQHQVDATTRAAKMAGFEYCELLQEPIAASMAYGLTGKNTTGFWLVFDFGGGTFDAALMKVEDGIIKVHATSGDNLLGGKNIDYAIIDNILIPHLENNYSIKKILNNEGGRKLLFDSLKRPAEEIKIMLSTTEGKVVYSSEDNPWGKDDNGDELELEDITISSNTFETIVQPIFQRAIDICINLLKRKNMTGRELDTVIMVGGPTYLEPLRNMIRAQITERIDFSIDPMTVVTKGAALYASTKDIPLELQVRDKAKIQLTLIYPETTVESKVKLGIKVEREQTEGDIPLKIFAEITRNDIGWSSGKLEIVDDAETVDLHLNTGKSNGFTITLYNEQGNKFPCEPSSFSIIQGTKVGKATLPYNVCIEAIYTKHAKKCLIPCDGLKKETPLPAKGSQNFFTQKDLRPGNKNDFFEIGIYETEEPYSLAFPHGWIQTISITGEDLPQFLPKDSDVEIELRFDESRKITCSCYFPCLDETVDKVIQGRVEKSIPAEKLEQDINNTRNSLSMLSSESKGLNENTISKLETKLAELNEHLAQGRSDRDRRDEVANKISEVIEEIEEIRDKSQWPKAEEEMDKALLLVEQTQQRSGNEKTVKALDELRTQVGKVRNDRDTKAAKELKDALYALDYQMLKDNTGFWASYIANFDNHFDSCEWLDRSAARRLVDEGKENLATAPSLSRLKEIVFSLFRLLPEKTESIGDTDLKILRH